MFNVKEVPWKVILVFLLVSTSITALINLVIFPSSLLGPIAKLTSNLIDGTLQVNLLHLLVFSIIIFGWGKLRPIDVGLDWTKLAQGLWLTAVLWLGIQGIDLLLHWINGDIHLDPSWSERGPTRIIGGLIAQLAGNALFEEIQYRGFYLSQFYLKLKNQSGRVRLTWAILSMLGLFVLSHVPNRIYFGYSLADIPLDFALLFAWGLFFTAIYLISGNLFLAIGVHALSNRPTLITEPVFPPEALLFIVTWILLAVLSLQKRQRRLRGEIEAFAGP